MIDARGLSCPQPVLLLKKAMKSGAAEYEIIVDNITAEENISRFAGNMGYNVSVSEKDGEYTLEIRK